MIEKPTNLCHPFPPVHPPTRLQPLRWPPLHNHPGTRAGLARDPLDNEEEDDDNSCNSFAKTAASWMEQSRLFPTVPLPRVPPVIVMMHKGEILILNKEDEQKQANHGNHPHDGRGGIVDLAGTRSETIIRRLLNHGPLAWNKIARMKTKVKDASWTRIGTRTHLFLYL